MSSQYSSPLFPGIAQFFDANGAPLAGGQLAIYLEGMSTFAQVWSEPTLTQPQTNPIVLDAAGRGVAWVAPGTYTAVLTDANGVIQWSLPAGITVGSGGGSGPVGNSSAFPTGTDSGSVNNIVWVPVTGSYPTLSTQMVVAVQSVAQANTGPTTFTWNGTDYPLLGQNGLALQGGELIPGANLLVLAQGGSSGVSSFQIVANPGGALPVVLPSQSNQAVNLGALAASKGATLVNYNSGATGVTTRSVAARLADWPSVMDFGADPTGVSDSSAAFQAALTAYQTVFIPEGNYFINSLLSSQGNVLVGAGSQSVKIFATSNGFLSASLGANAGMEISGMTVAQSDTGAVGTAFSVTATAAGAGTVVFSDVIIGGNASNPNALTGSFATDVSLISTDGAEFTNCQFTSMAGAVSSTHVTINGTASITSFQTVFTSCTFTLGEYGVYVGNGTTSYVQGVVFVGCQFVSIHNQSVFWDNSASGFLADWLSLNGCLLSGNTTILYVNNLLHFQMNGCYVLSAEAASGTNPVQVECSTCSSGLIVGNSFYAGNTPTAIGLSISGSGTGGLNISGNSFLYYNGSGAIPIQTASDTSGNQIYNNGYTACNNNSIAGSNLVFDSTQNNYSGVLSNLPIYVGSSPIGPANALALGLRQPANGDNTLMMMRATDTSPTGYFLRFVNNANSTNLFAADVNGNLVANEAEINTLVCAGSAQVDSLSCSGAATFSPGTSGNQGINFSQLANGSLTISANTLGATNSGTLQGTSGGSVVWTMPEQGVYKKFVAYLNNYQNTTKTEQSITFPTAFSNPPNLIATGSVSSESPQFLVSSVILPISTSFGVSGLIIIEGI